MSYKRLGVAGIAAALLCALSLSAKTSGGSPRPERISLRVNAEAVPASFDMEIRDGEVVSMTAVKKDGTRMALKAQSKPTYATECTAGYKLRCWEDEKQMMSMCICDPGFGHSMGGGSFALRGDAVVLLTN